MNIDILLLDGTLVTTDVYEFDFGLIVAGHELGDEPVSNDNAIKMARLITREFLNVMRTTPVEVIDVYRRIWWINPAHVMAVRFEEPQV